MKRKPGLLARIDAARVTDWIASMGGPRSADTLDEILDPGWRQVLRLSDDEIAEIIAREPNSKLGVLAASVMRKRESWRAPGRWALFISAASLLLALIAFVRTL